MTEGYGFCGPVPPNFFVLNNQTGQRSIGVFPAGSCPDLTGSHSYSHQGVRLSRDAAISVAAGLAALLILLAMLWVLFIRRQQDGKSRSMQMSLMGGSSLSSGAQDSLETVYLELNKFSETIILGQGTFGKVYKARWNGVLVAIKALNNSAQEVEEDLQKEAAILSSLRHPHIIKYLGLFKDDSGKYSMVMEYMQGGNLAAAFAADRKERRSLAWHGKGKLVAQGVASGLAYLHSKKVVSFDVKPANILLNNSKTVAKLSDMGLAKLLTQSQTMTMMRGTLDYMAPELMDALPYDGKTTQSYPITSAVDVYSFGLVLWQIITGEAPDRAAGALRMPRVPEECPADILTYYQACLHTDPSKRPSAAELAQKLKL